LSEYGHSADASRPLVVACGALASELRAVLSQLDADVELRFLPANLHNRPERIVPALDAALDGVDGRPVLIGYADCGTGGALDEWLDHRPDVRRLPGAHCYEVFAGHELFGALHDAEPGTFYLTDFLTKHFEALVWQGLGLDRHPELLTTYFGNYTRVVLLSQSDDPAIVASATTAAGRLGLAFVHRPVGYSRLGDAVSVGIRRAVA
jgi:Protein of unknown function (DUF1638)